MMRPCTYSRVRCPGRNISAPKVRGRVEFTDSWSSITSMSMRRSDTRTSTFRCPQLGQ